MESPPSPCEVRRDLAHEFCAAAGPTEREMLARYRAFVDAVYRQSAGGPPLADLHEAIRRGTVDTSAVFAMLAGLPFEDWTSHPPSL